MTGDPVMMYPVLKRGRLIRLEKHSRVMDLPGTAYSAPAVKPTEEGVNRKNLSTGAKSRPGQETAKPIRLPRTNDSRGVSRI